MAALNFNQRVYALVRRIPPGNILTYGRIAQMLGVPRGARAVGWALNALAPNSDVPWYRVVTVSGRITEKFEPHHADMQRALLEAEGVQFDDKDHLKIRRHNAIIWSPPLPEYVDLIGDFPGEQT